MSAHLVETSEEDSFLAVTRRVADLLNEGQERTVLADTPGSRFATECETLLAETKFAELLELLVGKSDLLFTKLDRGDLECCLDVLAHLVARIPAPELPAAVTALTKALTGQVDNRAEVRLQGLATLHNALSDHQRQFEVVLATLRYAKASSLSHLLSAVLPGRVEAWTKEWRLGAADERSLCLAAADLLRSSKKRKGVKDAYALTLKALATLELSSGPEVAAVKGEAALAVSDFIRSADTFQFDLLENPAITQLATDAKYAPLHKLLTTVIDGNVVTLQSFIKDNKKVLEEARVNADDVLVKTRIMALLALAAQSTEVSFPAVKSALNVEDNEVEAWVVRAIGKKLLEARIDQLAGRITIIKSVQRTFSRTQWGQLRSQLAAWKDNVHNIVNTVSIQKDMSMGRGLHAVGGRIPGKA